MKEFRNQLKELPQELFDEINSLFEKYGMDNVNVLDVKVTPTQEGIALNCEQQGKKLECRRYRDGSVRCRCVN